MSRRVEIIGGKGCSKLLSGNSPSRCSSRRLQTYEPMHPSSSYSMASHPGASINGPFACLVICVTGLSKETRKQVMVATERLGGQYSPNLHPRCTHLVVQSIGGRKFEHALKHGPKNGLFVVTLGWFVDSVRKNVRLNEYLYIVKNTAENGILHGSNAPENACLPVDLRKDIKLTNKAGELQPWIPERKLKKSLESALSGRTMYLDLDISDTMQCKVIQAASREGASFVDQWFVGCGSDYVVCEGPSIHKYMGHADYIVTPLWVLKTAKEKYVQRLVHMSADLARKTGTVLADLENGIRGEDARGEDVSQVSYNFKSKASHEERQKMANLAKIGVRDRRAFRMQACQTPIQPITPSVLLDSICWSVSEPPSTASIYCDGFILEDASEERTSIFFDAKCDVKAADDSLTVSSRLLTESEKAKIVFRNHFLTVLFPIDRFAEMGPSSRTFFSERGFTCLQVLEHIYAFYQENMSGVEIEAAIHTDSRHGDRLRSVYSGSEAAELGFVAFRRVDFLGSRRSFEMLKRVAGDNCNNVYELVIRA